MKNIFFRNSCSLKLNKYSIYYNYKSKYRNHMIRKEFKFIMKIKRSVLSFYSYYLFYSRYREKKITSTWIQFCYRNYSFGKSKSKNYFNFFLQKTNQTFYWMIAQYFSHTLTWKLKHKIYFLWVKVCVSEYSDK